MAVVQNFNNQDNNDQQQNQQQIQNNQFVNKPVSVSGSSAPGVSAPSAAPTIGQGTSNNSNPTTSGRFTNLLNYVNANNSYNSNTDPTKGSGLAGMMNSNFQNDSNKIKNNLDTSQSQFTTQANQNHVTYNPNIVNQALADPNAFIQNQDNLNNFNSQMDAQYKGPTSLDGSDSLKSQIDTLNSATDLTGNEAGRFTLLSRMFGKPSYTSGQQGLDNLLLQGNPDQLNSLLKSRSISSNLTNALDSTKAQDANIAAKYAQDANDVQTQTGNAISGGITGFGTYAQNLYNQDATDQNKAYYTALQNLRNGAMSKTDLSKFGLTDGTALYPGINLTDYIHTNPISQFNVLSSDDYKKIQALQKLSGNKASNDASKILSTYVGNASQGGGYDPNNPYTFDKSAFQSSIDDAKNGYQNALKSILGDNPNTLNPVQALAQYQSTLDAANSAPPSPTPNDLGLGYYKVNPQNGQPMWDTNTIQTAGGEATPDYQLMPAQPSSALSDDDKAKLQSQISSLNNLISKYGIDKSSGDFLNKLHSIDDGTVASSPSIMPRGGGKGPMIRPS